LFPLGEEQGAMIDFKCAGCGKVIQIDDSQAGHKILCPHCRNIQDVPGSNLPSIGLICPNCNNDMQLSPTTAGTMQRCPYCSSMVAIPLMGKADVGGGCFGLIAMLAAIVTTTLVCMALLVGG
jgi:DNA-directed RNA polymerase subunit RPC12/RpoP